MSKNNSHLLKYEYDEYWLENTIYDKKNKKDEEKREEPKKECSHPNKYKVMMIVTSFMYCPDCKDEVK